MLKEKIGIGAFGAYTYVVVYPPSRKDVAIREEPHDEELAEGTTGARHGSAAAHRGFGREKSEHRGDRTHSRSHCSDPRDKKPNSTMSCHTPEEVDAFVNYQYEKTLCEHRLSTPNTPTTKRSCVRSEGLHHSKYMKVSEEQVTEWRRAIRPILERYCNERIRTDEERFSRLHHGYMNVAEVLTRSQRFVWKLGDMEDRNHTIPYQYAVLREFVRKNRSKPPTCPLMAEVYQICDTRVCVDEHPTTWPLRDAMEADRLLDQTSWPRGTPFTTSA